MIDLQKLLNTMSDVSKNERSKYQATFGALINKLKNADDSCTISPEIKGIGAYRGYYSDIVLCTESGSPAYNEDYDYMSSGQDDWKKLQENSVEIDFSGTPKEIAKKLESIIGYYFDGYKGGFNKITLNTPLWLAKDYGDCSDIAVMEITDDLKLITKLID